MIRLRSHSIVILIRARDILSHLSVYGNPKYLSGRQFFSFLSPDFSQIKQKRTLKHQGPLSFRRSAGRCHASAPGRGLCSAPLRRRCFRCGAAAGICRAPAGIGSGICCIVAGICAGAVPIGTIASICVRRLLNLMIGTGSRRHIFCEERTRRQMAAAGSMPLDRQ